MSDLPMASINTSRVLTCALRVYGTEVLLSANDFEDLQKVADLIAEGHKLRRDACHWTSIKKAIE